MRLNWGLGKNSEQHGSTYSIEAIRFKYDKINYSVPPDKTLREGYQPCLILKLKGSRQRGNDVEEHNARLEIDFDEIAEIKKALDLH